MNIILFGANGMLGSYIYYYLHNRYNIITFTKKDLDIYSASFNDIENIFIKYNVDNTFTIINATGIIPQLGTNDYKLYIKINTIFPIWLESLSKQYHCQMIHPTTDCVFNGIGEKYTELNDADDDNIYASTKYLGEPENCCIIRTSIIGEEMRNRRSLVEWVKKNKDGEINGYVNHYWNGITCLQFAKIVDDIIKNNLFWRGVRHIYSPDSISKYRLVSLINETFQLNIKINKYKCEKLVNRTLSSIYNPIFEIPELEKQINEMKDFNLVHNCKIK